MDDWRQLFKDADDRFEFVDAHAQEGQGLAVLRFSWGLDAAPATATREIGYPLESDEEIGRLSNQHDVIKDEMGQLVLAPIDLSAPLRILDSGTADGTWIRDLSASTAPVQHTFVGTDVDPSNFPKEQSANQTYQVQDINKPWPGEWNESFDFVHQRLVLNAAGPAQQQAVQSVLALVKPGGWIQLLEATNEVPEQNGPAMRDLDALMKSVFNAVGSNLRLTDELPAWLKAAGLVDIEDRIVTMKLGAMNPDPELGKRGTYSSMVAARMLSEFAKSESPTSCCPSQVRGANQ
jgi:SAM-dependent methyltransferase